MRQRTTRRRALKSMGAAAAVPVLQTTGWAGEESLAAVAGPDRVCVRNGKTWLRGRAAAPKVRWSKVSGPGSVRFANAASAETTATFGAVGDYDLAFTAKAEGGATSRSVLRVSVTNPPPVKQLDAVYTKSFRIQSKFWGPRAKALMVTWIPHCIEVISRSDVRLGEGGIDNFVEAGKKLRGEKAGYHKGYVFSNAWVHQTVESMCIALMVDAQGDSEIEKAHALFRQTLEDWIPKILSAQEPDGYLQTAFTLDRLGRKGEVIPSSKFAHWDPAHRGDHEGYVSGYFLEAAINHYLMTGKKDSRLYDAAKRLADCWERNLGPAPKKPWFDGHQQMEQGLVRFGRFVNDMEGGGKGDRYIALAKFLLDSRASIPRDRHEYDQSHVPVTEQYEAVGHAVRAAYTYSGMADVAVETHDPDYQSAVRSLWENIVHRKYYVTGGVGSISRSEGFGPNYSLPNDGYCESCSSCGMIFFHWKMNLAYHDARYVDNYEETMYNALLGSTNLKGDLFYYTNPLDSTKGRSSWHQCPCCVGNLARTLLMVPTWAYARSADSVYVNLYIGSTVTVENAAGTDVEMVQETDYPWNGKVRITVNPRERRTFALRLRVPNRATSRLYTTSPEVRGMTSLAVNGKAVRPEVRDGYAVIRREWKAGDSVEFELPMAVQRLTPSERVEALRGKVAVRYGPLVYNFEAVDQDLTKRLGLGPLRAEWRGDLLGGVMVVRGAFADGTPAMAVPNYARLNRDSGLPAEGGPRSGSPDLYMGPNAVAPAAGAPAPPREAVAARSVVWIAAG